MKSRLTALTMFVGMMIGVPSTASAQVIFADGFESYTSGNVLPPQGGWIDFGGSQPIIVSSTQAHSGADSMRLSEGTAMGNGYGSDVYRNFGGIRSSGQVQMNWWQFVEPTVDSNAFMYISTGTMPTTFQTGLDLRTDVQNANGFGSSQLVVQDIGGVPTLVASPPAAILGAWVEHSLSINLDTNLYQYRYNGNLVANQLQWDTTPGDGVTLGGINFWMQIGNANAVNAFVYYDDFSVVPEPSSLLLLPMGALALKLRRRKAAK